MNIFMTNQPLLELLLGARYPIRYDKLHICKRVTPWRNSSEKMGSVEIPFSKDSLLLINRIEGDPLSPPEGEAAHGEHPLDPSFYRVSTEPKNAEAVLPRRVLGRPLRRKSSQYYRYNRVRAGSNHMEFTSTE
jgi:hypothetical protein